MPLIIAGIDEAGYGPLLGPLCVGMTAFRVDSWQPGDPAPNLWRLLNGAVCRKANDKARRIAVDDSKKLKLPNDGAADDRPGAKHPLVHLERAVLAFLAATPGCPCPRPATDLELFDVIGTSHEPHPWYGGEPRPIPCGITGPEVGIAANVLNRALASRGVTPVHMACRAVCESAFNREVERAGTKAAATALALAEHIRHAWDAWSDTDTEDPTLAAQLGPRLICDRQGGRVSYRGLLSRIIPEATVSELEESERCSRYLLRTEASGGAGCRAMTVTFMPEAEGAHLPVALASMLAKLTRELMMARFNAYWRALVPEIKPTAGYVQDGRRYLADLEAAGVLTDELRHVMVRRA